MNGTGIAYLRAEGRRRSVGPGHRAASLILFALSVFFLSACSQTISSPRKALVFGINNYATVRPNLSYCVADAQSMSALLLSRGFDSAETGTDAGATKAAIRTAITTASSASDSVLVLYFSGHGAVYSGAYYIIPQDATWDTSTWISPEELASWLNAAGTDKIIVILDSCNSGGFIGDTGEAVDTSPASISGNSVPAFPLSAITRFADLLGRNASASGKPGPIVISAAGSGEESWESGIYGHGVFTYYLLQAASSGDSDNDGNVTASEAFAYASAAIKSKWNVNYTPFLPHISGGSRDLVLFKAN